MHLFMRWGAYKFMGMMDLVLLMPMEEDDVVMMMMMTMRH